MAQAWRQIPDIEPLAGDPAAMRGVLPLDLCLRHGGTAHVDLRYEVVGDPAAPVVIVAGGISAGRHAVASTDFPEPGWWQAQADALILSDHRLLSIDWVGADGSVDRVIDAADQAEALRHLLDHLGIEQVRAFVGASYGAMVGMHFAALFPARLDRLLAISAADRAHPFASACRALQRQALDLGQRHGDPAGGVALARALAILTYRTPEEFAARFVEPPQVDAPDTVRVSAQNYLDHQGAKHAARTSCAAYRRLSESIDLHRIDPTGIGVPCTFVAVDRDALVPPADIEALADSVPGARFFLIPSTFGHDAFLKEEAEIAAILTRFFDPLETVR